MARTNYILMRWW